MKISLIGPMAAGKSTVGKLLAQHLTWPFYDTDSLIETEMQCSISDIFKHHGEAKFRQLETLTLQKLFSTPENCIIATGGGIIHNPENRQLLRTHSAVFFLDASIQTQLERTQGDTTRPILQVPNPSAKLQALRKERLPLYQATAHHTLSVDTHPPAELVLQIFKQREFI